MSKPQVITICKHCGNVAKSTVDLKMVNKEINMIGLSCRVTRFLASHRISTYGQLALRTQFDVLMENGIGEVTLNELIGLLASVNMKFGLRRIEVDMAKESA